MAVNYHADLGQKKSALIVRYQPYLRTLDRVYARYTILLVGLSCAVF